MSDKKQTVVFYTGIKSVPIITKQLLLTGREQDTPAAFIHKGTTPEQQVYRGTLGSLEAMVAEYNIKPPTLIIIGDVINTFDERYLAGIGYLSPIS